MSARANSIVIDHNWEYVDEKAKEERETLNKMSKKTFWDKIPADTFNQNAGSVFLRLFPGTYSHQTTKKEN